MLRVYTPSDPQEHRCHSGKCVLRYRSTIRGELRESVRTPLAIACAADFRRQGHMNRHGPQIGSDRGSRTVALKDMLLRAGESRLKDNQFADVLGQFDQSWVLKI